MSDLTEIAKSLRLVGLTEVDNAADLIEQQAARIATLEAQIAEAGKQESVAASCESCDGEGLIGSHACPDCRPDSGEKSVGPLAWMVISDWTCRPLLTTDKSVTLGWYADKREVIPLYAAPLPQSGEDRKDAELREAARQFHNLTQGDNEVIIRPPNAEKRDAIIAAGERLRAALAKQEGK